LLILKEAPQESGRFTRVIMIIYVMALSFHGIPLLGALATIQLVIVVVILGK